MNNKTVKTIFYISTCLLTALMLMSAAMYIFNYEMVSETFSKLNFPSFIIYPLAALKVLGLIAIWTNKSKTLKEWAYAGFFFDFILALSAHINVSDGAYIPAAAALVLWLISYYTDRKSRNLDTSI